MKNKRAGKNTLNNEYLDSLEDSINTDPDGSWTGVCTDDPMEKPIQDADDL